MVSDRYQRHGAELAGERNPMSGGMGRLSGVRAMLRHGPTAARPRSVAAGLAHAALRAVTTNPSATGPVPPEAGQGRWWRQQFSDEHGPDESGDPDRQGQTVANGPQVDYRAASPSGVALLPTSVANYSDRSCLGSRMSRRSLVISI